MPGRATISDPGCPAAPSSLGGRERSVLSSRVVPATKPIWPAPTALTVGGGSSVTIRGPSELSLRTSTGISRPRWAWISAMPSARLGNFVFPSRTKTSLGSSPCAGSGDVTASSTRMTGVRPRRCSTDTVVPEGIVSFASSNSGSGDISFITLEPCSPSKTTVRGAPLLDAAAKSRAAASSAGLPFTETRRMPGRTPSRPSSASCSSKDFRSSGRPGGSDISTGDEAGNTPISRRFAPPISGTTANSSGSSTPGRSTMSRTGSPRRDIAAASTRSVNSSGLRPLTLVTTSPALKPGRASPAAVALVGMAAAAGEPGKVPPICGGSVLRPVMKTRTKSTAARMRFITTPAEMTIIRFQGRVFW